jgi:hypothetical protein
MFREEAGTVGLSGRDLPAAEALAGHANVVARARLYAASGVFPGQDTSRLQAQAYLDLLGGVPATDRIAFAATAGAGPPADPGPDAGRDDDVPFDEDDDGPGSPPGTGADERGPGGGSSPLARDSGSGDLVGAADVSGGTGYLDSDDDDYMPDLDDEDDILDLDRDSGDGPELGDDGDIQDLDGDSGDGPKPGGDGVAAEPDGDDGGGPGEPGAPEAPTSQLAEVTVPLATLQGNAERAGDNRLLGPLDPALARQLAAAAARSPHSRWELIVVDDHGYATGQGIARPSRGARPQTHPPGPALSALPARVNITVTEKLLRLLATQGAQPQSPVRESRPRSGAPPGDDWQLIPAKPGTWTLTLPGGRQLTVRFDVVPTHDCDHRYQTNSYQPGDRLRRLVQVRDHECTFPTCSRAAGESDFEHATPFDKGGKTDACNAGARSRRCHRVKQSPGWTVTQPKPGWHQWTTPTGRTYTQGPWRYTA